MAIGNFLVQLFILVSLRDFILIFFTKKSKHDIEKAKRLDELRYTKFKTLEEQKEFIKLKDDKQPFSLKRLVFNIIYFLAGFFTLRYGFEVFDVNLNFWTAFLIVVPLAVMFSIILYKMNLKENNLIEMFGGKRGK